MQTFGAGNLRRVHFAGLRASDRVKLFPAGSERRCGLLMERADGAHGGAVRRRTGGNEMRLP